MAQTLARHSTVVLTMDRYSHVALDEQAEALASLPDLSAAIEAQLATGTDDATVTDLADCLARNGSESSNLVQRDAVFAADTYVDGELRTAPENAANGDNSRAVSEVRLLGLEPKTYGLKVRCSTD